MSHEYVKTKIKDNFNIDIVTLKYLGSGYDSDAYLINDEYVFKFAKHKLAYKDYIKEKRILDFLKDNLKSNIKIPEIEYFVTDKEYAIMGYKAIKGILITPKIYKKMTKVQKSKLAHEIAKFLKEIHSLNTEEIIKYTTNNKEECIKDLQILKDEIYKKLNKNEINFIEDIFNRIINNNKIFNGNKCLCHNDFNYDHIIVNENYELEGVIDFGDACITDEYCDFLYLLEDNDKEVGRKFGLEVIKYYDMKDIETALEYADLKKEYYPIETILCGIKNESKQLFNEGIKILKNNIKGEEKL